MKSWRVWRLIILIVVLGALGWTLRSRGTAFRLGSALASIETEYRTEHEWAVRQTATDIDAMAAFADRRSPRSPEQPLPDTPWEPEAFAAVVNQSFGNTNAPPAIDGEAPDLYPALTALDIAALVESANVASKALATNMRDPRAHESAALVLGAFALREAADQFNDVRWALNRMTAHLAVAGALRGGEGASADGAIATATLSALANRQARASAELAALGTGTPPEPLNAWIRALNLRLTQDWRALPDPSQATRLEKLEYFRARRATVRRRRAVEDLETVGEEIAADFGRIAQDGALGVQDGHRFISDALPLELEEAADAYQRVQGRPMPARLSEALNHRAAGLIVESPQVLPWGAWAEFFQRHIAMNIGMVDGFHRAMLGDYEGAEATKEDFDQRLGELTMFPLGTLRRTKGTAATEADMTHVSKVVDLAATAPELIAYRAWVFFEAGSKAESVPRSMPKATDWFALPSAKVPYEAGHRHSEGLRATGLALEALINAAPTDTVLLTAAAIGAAKDPAVAHARGLLEQRHDYDLRALDSSLKTVTAASHRAVLLRKSCALSSRDCLELASVLARLGQEAQAAETYERAFADPLMDSVALAADAGWLVNYYHRNKRNADALALAERAASSGSWNGMTTYGRLLERLGRLDEAEKSIGEAAIGYKSYEQLLGFYYRRVEIDRHTAYEAKWKRWLAEVFPNGLQPEPTTTTGTPKTGVFVYADSEASRKAGIRAGDIIVGLEGWRVDSFEQYRAINAFKDDEPRVQLTLWRGQLIKVDTQMPGRLFGTDIRTHPMKGWIQ